MRAVHGLVWGRDEVELFLIHRDVVMLELRDRVLDLDLGVVNIHVRAVLHEHVADGEGGRLPHVARVLFESEAQDRDLLLRDSVEQCMDDPLCEGRLLVVVHVHDLLPVGRHFVEAELFADVNEVEDVLLEAGAAEADGGAEELGPDAGVCADGPGHLSDVRARALAKPGYGVDTAHALRQHGVGHELGELGAPEVGGEDLVPWHPVCVDVHEDCHSVFQLPTDKHAVGLVQVLHGRALGQELWVREDPEVLADGAADCLVCREHAVQRRRGLHRHCGLFNDNLAPVRILRYCSANTFDESEVRSTPRTHTLRLRGRVH
mmetsp:Transcript_150128/g.418289  ORF Transcript_150128/g.418289 Transcript_150128/m.418289 type:complete len:319 (-) Transcript_150128:404-1360(-)